MGYCTSIRLVAVVAVGGVSVAILVVLNVRRSRVARESIRTRLSRRSGLVTSPEGTASASSVTVGWRGTKTLLTLVITGQSNLEEDANKEEEAGFWELVVTHR